VGEVFFFFVFGFGVSLGSGVGEVFLCFGDGDGVGVGLFLEGECFRFRAGVGVGVEKNFLIFSPNDSSARIVCSPQPMNNSRRTRSAVFKRTETGLGRQLLQNRFV
jgi:hypothetical protein